jgi:hypothetical protein
MISGYVDTVEQYRRDLERDRRAAKRAEARAEPREVVAARLAARRQRLASGERLCSCFVCRTGAMEVVLYFLREPDGPVKIGVTHVGNTTARSFTVDDRRKQVEGASGRRLVTLAWLSGSRQYEFHVHAKFDHLRTVGEWFRPEPELLDYIATVAVVRS